MRIGHGYDAHRFKNSADRKLILGGVTIPHKRGLDGHSDADVLCHAVCDALLGAAAMGDIGKHFPPSDDRFKDADSVELLREVAKMLAANGFLVFNVDATIIAEEPKLAPYIDEMRKNLAAAMCVEVSQVSVKATTEEKMGFTGRREGMSAHAVCLIG